MIKIWMDFALASARLCHEAQEVMSLRLKKLAQGGSRSRTEAQLMVTEKGFALAEALGTLATGGSLHKVLRRYRGHVRTNKRRLSRPNGRLKHRCVKGNATPWSEPCWLTTRRA